MIIGLLTVFGWTKTVHYFPGSWSLSRWWCVILVRIFEVLELVLRSFFATTVLIWAAALIRFEPFHSQDSIPTDLDDPRLSWNQSFHCQSWNKKFRIFGCKLEMNWIRDTLGLQSTCHISFLERNSFQPVRIRLSVPFISIHDLYSIQCIYDYTVYLKNAHPNQVTSVVIIDTCYMYSGDMRNLR